MIYITYENPDHNTSGHVMGGGTLKHMRTRDRETSGKVLSVQADGHELERIALTFNNLPSSRLARVQTWRGDLAQFIVDHLC